MVSKRHSRNKAASGAKGKSKSNGVWRGCPLAKANKAYRKADGLTLANRCNLPTCDACTEHVIRERRESGHAMHTAFELRYRAFTVNVLRVPLAEFGFAEIEDIYNAIDDIVRKLKAVTQGALAKVEIGFSKRDRLSGQPDVLLHVHGEAACTSRDSVRRMRQVLRAFADDIKVKKANHGWTRYLIKGIVAKEKAAPEHVAAVHRLLRDWWECRGRPKCYAISGVYNGKASRWPRSVADKLWRRRKAMEIKSVISRLYSIHKIDKEYRRSKAYMKWRHLAPYVAEPRSHRRTPRSNPSTSRKRSGRKEGTGVMPSRS